MKHTIQKLSTLLLITLSLVVTSHVYANEQRGLEIAKQTDLKDTGYSDSTARLVMELKNKQGNTSIRHVRVKNLEVEGDGDKGMSIFDQPADIKGTAFLTYSHSL